MDSRAATGSRALALCTAGRLQAIAGLAPNPRQKPRGHLRVQVNRDVRHGAEGGLVSSRGGIRLATTASKESIMRQVSSGLSCSTRGWIRFPPLARAFLAAGSSLGAQIGGSFECFSDPRSRRARPVIRGENRWGGVLLGRKKTLER